MSTIKTLAYNPELFSKLKEKYPDKIPSDQNLEAFLIKTGYHPKGVRNIVKSYRLTLEFLNAETAGFDVEHKRNTEIAADKVESVDDKLALPISNNGEERSEQSVLIFKISKNSTARVKFDGKASQESVGKLIKLLELSIDTFPTEAEILDERA